MRPTKYNKTIQEKANWYVNGGYKGQGAQFPSTKGLAKLLSVAKKTLYNWRKYPEFLHTLELICIEQEIILIEGGLSGTFNASIVKLLLVNHGYSLNRKYTCKATGRSF